ncbi:protein spinster homolog 1-like [Eleutherodactylus coqui]|uniref:protein spinster homolog 1-like n=1 Tax=Eleutherodactylus coqui TaxID=57060 RepID=UPI0034623BA6
MNMVIYMDRFIASGLMPDLQKDFKMSDSASGLIYTAFIVSFMLIAPLFGYLGDRWNRKYIISVGIFLWTSVTLGMSFIPNQYFLLLIIRGLVGATEASFSTIAPSIIADLFVADQRSRMLSIFYLTIPVGSGLGYIVGPKVTSAANGNWHWAFRVSPGLGIIGFLLMTILIKEPPRGAAEGKRTNTSLNASHWVSDIKTLFKNPSFMFSSLGYAAVAFVAGAIGLWAPSFLMRARNLTPCQTGPCINNDSLIFGVLTLISGILGVIVGVEISKRCRKFNPRADPIICACGMLGATPFLFLALGLAKINLVATYVFIFIAETLISLNWAIVTDILLYVVTPTRRSTAQAMQIIMSHLLGDAGSPYIIGALAELIRRGKQESPLIMFNSMEYALMACGGVVIIGGLFFTATALFIVKDRQKAVMESED